MPRFYRALGLLNNSARVTELLPAWWALLRRVHQVRVLPGVDCCVGRSHVGSDEALGMKRHQSRPPIDTGSGSSLDSGSRRT